MLAQDAAQWDGLFLTITNILLFIIGAVSVVMIVIGGIRYVVSGGDQGAITSAKNTILYAIIGIVVTIGAYAIVNFVGTQFGSDGKTTPTRIDWWPATRYVAGGLTVVAAGIAALRKSSGALRLVLRLTARTAAIWLPRAERAGYVERTHAMMLRAGRWERVELIWYILLLAPRMGVRRWHARKLLGGGR